MVVLEGAPWGSREDADSKSFKPRAVRHGGPGRSEVPPSFLCPITGQIFAEPVVAGDGHTYEGYAIETWLRSHNESPLTRERIPRELRPNRALKELIAEWQRDQKRSIDESGSDIDFEELQLGLGVLGRGAHKRVERGRWGDCDVAVAICSSGDGLEVEANLMRRLGSHPQLVTFHGCSVDPSGHPCLVMELAEHGSLRGVLCDLEEEGAALGVPVVLMIALQVCEGMQALVAAGVVHRDLAARNVLVFNKLSPSNPESVKVKVADFGLSRVQRYMNSATGVNSTGGLPVRHMPPEAIERGRWREKSDVWAFGVLLWEVASMGMIPYSSLGVHASDNEVKSGVCAGSLRLPKPPGCPDFLYELMTACWAQNARDRPTFQELHSKLYGLAVQLEQTRLPSMRMSVDEARLLEDSPRSAIIVEQVDSIVRSISGSDGQLLALRRLGVTSLEMLGMATDRHLEAAGLSKEQVAECRSKVLVLMTVCKTERVQQAHAILRRKFNQNVADALLPKADGNGRWTFPSVSSRMELLFKSISAQEIDALSHMMEPALCEDGTWMFNNALTELSLINLGQFCCIGKQICSAIHPLQNPDGGWVFHNLRILRLAGMQAGWCAQHCLSDADLSTLLFAPMEGCLEPSSVKYLASLMQGRQQPSGHFSWNQSLQTLVLKDNKLTDESMLVLATSMEPLRSSGAGEWCQDSHLTSLVLGPGNSIGRTGAEALLRTLMPFRSSSDGVYVNNRLSLIDLAENPVCKDEEGRASCLAMVEQINAARQEVHTHPVSFLLRLS